MLNSMRRHAAGPIMKAFLALIVLSFAVWGIADVFRIGGANDIAQVGGTKIGIETFRDTFNRALQRASSQVGRPLTAADGRAIGLDQQVLGELMAEATLDENARELKIGIPDAAVADAITRDPNFQGPNGQFDASRFDQILRSNGLNEAFYVAEQRRLMARRQILDGFVGGVGAPKALIEAVFRHQNERRSASYIVLPAPAEASIAPPDDSILRTFYDERTSVFQAPERRDLTILAATPTVLAGKEIVTDEEVRTRYDADVATTFTTPERRTVERITFPSAALAQEAAAKIAAGATFEEIATSRNVAAADLSLGLVRKDQIVDRPVADAAFALPQGQISAPVEGQFSNVLLRVTSIEPAVVRSFDDVKEELRSAIAAERAQAKMLDIHDQIEDARASGSTLAEAAQKSGLEMQTFAGVDRQGRLADGSSAAIPGDEAVLGPAFESDVGVENDPAQVDGEGFVWFDVTKVDPSRARTFEEARADVLTRWKSEEARKALDAKIDTALTDLRAGTLSLPDLASREGVEVLSVDKLARRGGDPVLGQAGTAQLFSTPRGSFGTAPSRDEAGRVVFQVTAIDTPQLNPLDPAATQLSERVAGTIESDLASQYALRLQADLGSSVNTQALVTALGGETEN